MLFSFWKWDKLKCWLLPTTINCCHTVCFFVAYTPLYVYMCVCVHEWILLLRIKLNSSVQFILTTFIYVVQLKLIVALYKVHIYIYLSYIELNHRLNCCLAIFIAYLYTHAHNIFFSLPTIKMHSIQFFSSFFCCSSFASLSHLTGR